MSEYRIVKLKLIENHQRRLTDMLQAYNTLVTLAEKPDSTFAFMEIVEHVGRTLCDTIPELDKYVENIT